MLPAIRNSIGQGLTALELVQCQQRYRMPLSPMRELETFLAGLEVSMGRLRCGFMEGALRLLLFMTCGSQNKRGSKTGGKPFHAKLSRKTGFHK